MTKRIRTTHPQKRERIRKPLVIQCEKICLGADVTMDDWPRAVFTVKYIDARGNTVTDSMEVPVEPPKK